MAVGFFALLVLAMYLVNMVTLRQIDSISNPSDTQLNARFKHAGVRGSTPPPVAAAEPSDKPQEDDTSSKYSASLPPLIVNFGAINGDENARDALEVTAKVTNCQRVRDYGLIDELKTSATAFCSDDTANEEDPKSRYTFYSVPDAGIHGTHFQNLRLDLRKARVYKPIHSMAQDGGNHDPRFRYQSIAPLCSCATAQDDEHGSPRVWNSLMAIDPEKRYTVCKSTGFNESFPDGVVTTFSGTNVVLMARKDDHNPFFQVSATLNAWIMLQVLKWGDHSTQLVYLDKGYESPVDALQKAMLSPDHPVIPGRDIYRHVVHFDSVLLAPYEFSGPMMQHLDNTEPCHHSALIADFRALALSKLNVPTQKADPKTCTITVISRRNYGGRVVQRRWRNENEVLETLRSDYGPSNSIADEKNATTPLYKYGTCRFQSIDFVDLPIEQQMQIMIESDVVISMHGAGLVNVLWTRPETLVIEIFPMLKRRYGYRNLCQFIGCNWKEFRGGKDIRLGRSREPNANDKTIPYNEWKAFFDPLLRAAVRDLEGRVDAART
uniref:Glycosyltransferase 61 catalytic domain-containing protein n=1 Tax=Globisporangium ultimum (strain ATCC 200006 / CBS 805.95 / DAOM BR144) TaxID=431595 RepID=K3X9J2_GLOUD